MNTLWTPTDWNAECELFKEFLSSKNVMYVDSFSMLMDDLTIPTAINDNLIKTLTETGIIYLDSTLIKPAVKELSFEEWKSQSICTTSEGKRVTFEELIKSVTDKF